MPSDQNSLKTSDSGDSKEVLRGLWRYCTASGSRVPRLFPRMHYAPQGNPRKGEFLHQIPQTFDQPMDCQFRAPGRTPLRHRRRPTLSNQATVFPRKAKILPANRYRFGQSTKPVSPHRVAFLAMPRATPVKIRVLPNRSFFQIFQLSFFLEQGIKTQLVLHTTFIEKSMNEDSLNFRDSNLEFRQSDWQSPHTPRGTLRRSPDTRPRLRRANEVTRNGNKPPENQ